MKILLTSPSTPTSRQITTILTHSSHAIHLFSSPSHHLTLLSPHTKSHPCPSITTSPFLWLTTLLTLLRTDNFDILIPTSEEIALISTALEEIEATGVKIAIPRFDALRRVMGRISAGKTVREIGVPQPESAVILSRAGGKACAHLVPGWVKRDIGRGVRRVETLGDLDCVIGEWEEKGMVRWEEGEKILLQKEVVGSLLLVCGVFERGTLRAWHSCVRVHEGPNGSATKKVGLPLPAVGEYLAVLGRGLGWHGALSLDAIIVDGKPCFVGIKPGIVEPMNAFLSGVDLVDMLIKVALEVEADRGESVRAGVEGMETHQLILALLRKAEEGRFRVVLESFMAVMKFERYGGSAEELTPIEEDWWSILIFVFVFLALVAGGKSMAERLEGYILNREALSPEGWRAIVAKVDRSTKGSN